MNRVKLESRRQDVDADGQWGEVHEVHEGRKEVCHFLPGCGGRKFFQFLPYLAGTSNFRAIGVFRLQMIKHQDEKVVIQGSAP